MIKNKYINSIATVALGVSLVQMPLSADGYCHLLEESAYESKDPSPRVILEFDELAEYYTDNPFVEKIKSVLSLFNEIEYNLGLQDFLIRNDDLLDILPELQDKIRSTFPDDTVLKVVLQDQMENESPQLVIFLSSQKQPLLFKELHAFHKNWYINQIDSIQDRIVVSV